MRARMPGLIDIKANPTVAWRVHRNAGSVVGPAMILHNLISLDTHGCYNSATGYYTVKVPGLYSISIVELGTNDASTGVFACDIQVNNSFICRCAVTKAAGGYQVTSSGSVVAALNTGDTISTYVNSLATYGTGTPHSVFTGYRIGP